MAGIGFTLRRIMGRSYLSFVVHAAFTGVFVVAGPWLLSIVNLSAFSGYLRSGTDESGFFGPLVYGFAVLLIVSSPIHYLFTRIASDYLYLKQERQATRTLLVFLAPAALVAVLAALAILYAADPAGRVYSPLFRVGYLMFAAGIQSLWLIMTMVSILRWHGRLLAVYLISILGVWAAVEGFGWTAAGTAMAAFGAANLLAAAGLLALCLSAHPPARIRTHTATIRQTFRDSRHLLAAGFLFTAALWSEKIIYWFVFGESGGSGLLRLYPAYDVAVYLANLSLIPGMVAFVIFGETTFATSLRKLLNSIENQPYRTIQEDKYRLRSTSQRALATILAVQFVTVLAAAFFTPDLIRLFPALDPTVWLVCLAVVCFQVAFICALNLLFYLNQFCPGMRIAAVYLASVVVLTLFEALGPLAPILPRGTGALIASILAAALAYRTLLVRIRTLDKDIYTANSCGPPRRKPGRQKVPRGEA